MTVQAQTPVNRYVYAGSPTFVFDFFLLAATDLVVTVDGAEKTQGIDYTVAGVGVPAGGSINYVGALTVGQIVVLERVTSLARAVNYQDVGDFLAATINADFDRLWMALQEAAYHLASDVLRVPAGESIGELPAAASRLDRLLGFDPVTGEPIATSLTVTQLASTVAAAYSAGSSTADAVTFVGVDNNPAHRRSVQSRLRDTPSVKDIGAVGDGIADDTAALQAALDTNQIHEIPPGKYRITSTLLINPSRNRNNGFVSRHNTSRYPYTAQAGGPSWTGVQETVIFYDGPASTTACCLAASAAAVGVEPASTFDATIWTLTLENITFDGNGKAGFPFYGARVQDIQMHHCKARGGTVAGISINGTYSGAIVSTHCYLNPGRGFELGGADDRWGWTINDKVNALTICELHLDGNGSDGTFRQANPTLRKNGCGLYFGPHRGVTIFGVTSENNFGANIIFEPTSSGNEIHGIYTELGCKYAPGGAGTDAISLGYATDQIGLMFIGSASALNCRVATYACATDKVWLTGVEPSPTRKESGFELYNVGLAGGVISEWGNWRPVNCALELEAITGTAPAAAFSIPAGLQFGAGKTTLQNYDEGTFTPAIVGQTTAGAATYSVQAGSYTRVGRDVSFTARIALSGAHTGTGNILITGLPFPVKNGNNYYAAAPITSVANLTTAVVSLAGRCEINTSQVTVWKRAAAATSETQAVIADLSATTSLVITGTYKV